jgi:hypothetical protein
MASEATCLTRAQLSSLTLGSASTNGLGGFICHLVDSRKPEASVATRRGNLDSFVDDLDELLLLDLPRQIESTPVFDATSTRVAPELFDWIQTDMRRLRDPSPSPTWRRTWIASSRSKTREPPRVGGSPFSTTTLTQTKRTRQL